MSEELKNAWLAIDQLRDSLPINAAWADWEVLDLIAERDALAKRLKEIEGQKPVAWQERVLLSANTWSDWYERTPMPTGAPRRIESDGAVFEVRPVFAEPASVPNPALAGKSEATDVRCQCGVRPATECAGAWEPGCDLGLSGSALRGEALDSSIDAAIAAEKEKSHE